MKKYDTYKPTKIEFLDEIPKHWEEKRMRFLGYLYGGLSGKSATDFNQLTNENNKHFIPFTNIANNFRIDPESLQTVVIAENENQNHVQKGDLFFLMSSENYDDVGKSAVLLDDLEDTYLNSFCKGFRITKRNIVPEFLNYQLHSKQLRHNLLTGANGFTRINLKIDKVIDLLTAIPPPEEQTAIAHYLDRKTAEIDELIADKKRLLELYEEEKTAIINQAVTKGINPDVKMKDSGIEWLGEIPEHWEVKRLKYVLREKLKYGANESAIDENLNHPRYIRITDFGNDGMLKQDTFKSLSPEKALDYLLNDGDILFARSGATVGKTFQFKNYEGIACFAGYLIKASVNTSLMNSDFLYLFTKSGAYEYWKNSIFNQATIQNIGADKYSSLELPVPPYEEQQSLVHHIETETARIDAKKAKTEKLIELLTEYRTALISEVVTGKVKVL